MIEPEKTNGKESEGSIQIFLLYVCMIMIAWAWSWLSTKFESLFILVAANTILYASIILPWQHEDEILERTTFYCIVYFSLTLILYSEFLRQ